MKAKTQKIAVSESNSATAKVAVNYKKSDIIKQGLTGKNLFAQKLKANKLNRLDLQTFSFQQKQFAKFGLKILDLVKGKMSDLTPKNLIPFLSESEITRQNENGQKWSFWQFENCALRFYKNRNKK